MVRCYAITVLLAGFSALTACGGASNAAFAPRVPAASVRPLSDVLYRFGASDAQNPIAGLLAGRHGEYYGTGTRGGTAHLGAVYEITADGKERELYSFDGSDGQEPQSALIMDKAGAIYGTTSSGGNGSCNEIGCGIVFKLTPGKRGWIESILYQFQGRTDGESPGGGLVMTKSGALLGTTVLGGTNHKFGDGTIFELTPSGSTYSKTIVHAFSGLPDGRYPNTALTSDSSGNVYGTTTQGGLADCRRFPEGAGTVFKLTPSGSTFTYSVIYRFDKCKNGAAPSSGLLPGARGVLYGLTAGGGEASGLSNGTVYELAPQGSNYSEKVLYSFKGGSDGADPEDIPGLVADRSGNLYGTTVGGGVITTCGGGCGTVFKLQRSKSGFTESVLYAFQGSGGDGWWPFGGVVIDNKGKLLGPTMHGAISSGCDCGTIFSIAP